jgi:hypothetical protein
MDFSDETDITSISTTGKIMQAESSSTRMLRTALALFPSPFIYPPDVLLFI